MCTEKQLQHISQKNSEAYHSIYESNVVAIFCMVHM